MFRGGPSTYDPELELVYEFSDPSKSGGDQVISVRNYGPNGGIPFDDAIDWDDLPSSSYDPGIYVKGLKLRKNGQIVASWPLGNPDTPPKLWVEKTTQSIDQDGHPSEGIRWDADATYWSVEVQVNFGDPNEPLDWEFLANNTFAQDPGIPIPKSPYLLMFTIIDRFRPWFLIWKSTGSFVPEAEAKAYCKKYWEWQPPAALPKAAPVTKAPAAKKGK